MCARAETPFTGPSLSIFPMPTFSFPLNKTLDHMRNPLSSSSSLYWALCCISGHIINTRKTVLHLSTGVASGNERSNIKMSGKHEAQVNRSMTGHCTEGEKENNRSAQFWGCLEEKHTNYTSKHNI